MRRRRLATLIAVVVIGGAGCGGAVTSVPTATPTQVAIAAPTAAPTVAPTPAAPASTSTAAPSAASPSGLMTQARQMHTATPLADGRVLLAGGFQSDVPVASTEVYEPTSGSFSATAPMAVVRVWDTATRLSDGRVLITGGNPVEWYFTGAMHASAQLFDPNTGTFSPTGSMATGRNLHTATLLRDGRVLIVGGSDAVHHALASAELYDPTTGRFSPAGSMKTARAFHTATLLADGRVLVTGGSVVGWDPVPGDFVASAEIYDPKTGTFSPTGSMAAERVFHTATLLNDGRVLVTGGAYTPTKGSIYSRDTAELYDVKTGTFSTAGSMSDERTFHQATLLPDGRVLVTGGSADGWTYPGIPLASADIFDPKSGTFTPTGPVADARFAHTATLLPDGRVLIAGGYDGKADLATAELYDPKTGTFSPTSPGG
jgi:hypothetical protein